MAHYAFLDANNIVTEVIVGRDEGDGVDWESHYAEVRGIPASQCKRTSYGTRGNQHGSGRPFRGNYAGIGYSYDPALDIFLPPQPFASFVVNRATASWEPPVSRPQAAAPQGKVWAWDEGVRQWKTTTPKRRPIQST